MGLSSPPAHQARLRMRPRARAVFSRESAAAKRRRPHLVVELAVDFGAARDTRHHELSFSHGARLGETDHHGAYGERRCCAIPHADDHALLRRASVGLRDQGGGRPKSPDTPLRCMRPGTSAMGWLSVASTLQCRCASSSGPAWTAGPVRDIDCCVTAPLEARRRAVDGARAAPTACPGTAGAGCPCATPGCR